MSSEKRGIRDFRGRTGEGPFMERVKPGATGSFSTTVRKEHLASSMGNLGVTVLATPTIAWLFECAATEVLGPIMQEGEISVGTWISVRHLKPTPAGMAVTTTVTLREVKGVRYLFEVTVQDELEKVAEGHIERAIIDGERFFRGVKEKEGRRMKGEG